MSKFDVDVVLYEATSELNDDYKEEGDVLITGGYYDRVVRSAALEVSDENHVKMCTYRRAIQVIRGVRLYMEQHGYFTLRATAYLGQQQALTRITDVTVTEWPPRNDQQRYYTSLGLKFVLITFGFFSPQNSSRALKMDFPVPGTDLVGHRHYGKFSLISYDHLPLDPAFRKV